MNKLNYGFMAFWAGFALTIAILQIWNFVLPINHLARILLIAFGLFGLRLNRRKLYQAVQNMPWRMVALIILLLIWLANRSILLPDNYDTWLYHLNAVQWPSTYPIVPGLGNLHTRLGFSSSYFLYPATLNTSIWFDRPYHVTSGLLFAVLLVQFVWQGWQVFKKPTGANAFDFIMIPVILRVMLLPRSIPSISNDPPLTILLIRS